MNLIEKIYGKKKPDITARELSTLLSMSVSGFDDQRVLVSRLMEIIP